MAINKTGGLQPQADKAGQERRDGWEPVIKGLQPTIVPLTEGHQPQTHGHQPAVAASTLPAIPQNVGSSVKAAPTSATTEASSKK